MDNDNIVSNLDTKSYLMLLREIKPYYHNRMGHTSFNINSIFKSAITNLYVVNIKNGDYQFVNFSITENELIKIIRKIKINKLKKYNYD